MSIGMRALFYVIVVICCGLNIGFAAKDLSEKHYMRFGFSLTLAIIFAANVIKCIFFQ